jgi:hypothetical protein
VQAFRLLNVLLWIWGAQAASLHCWAACAAAIILVGYVAFKVFGKLPNTAGRQPALPRTEIDGLESAAP